jgi:diacylglycerol kinase family enzyme
LTCLPGGATNVFCRILGIPTDVVDATEHLLGIADDWRPTAIDLGVVGERRFLFTAGLGLDASVTRRVDAHPRLKARLGPWYYASAAVAAFNSEYAMRPPRLSVEVDGETLEGVTAIVQNTTPYTYFASRPIELAEDVTLTSGTTAGVVLRRANPLDMPTVALRALSSRPRILRHRHIDGFATAGDVRIRSLDDRPLPLQVDGDYLGEVPEMVARVEPAALRVVA